MYSSRFPASSAARASPATAAASARRAADHGEQHSSAASVSTAEEARMVQPVRRPVVREKEKGWWEAIFIG